MPRQPTAKMWRKAARLLYQQRVRVHPGHGPFGCCATVEGDSGTYLVELWPGRDECECEFARHRTRARCTHILAAMMAWKAFYPREEREAEDDGSEDRETAAVWSERSAG